MTRRPRLAPASLARRRRSPDVPSLALFGFLIPLPLIGGIGARTAIVALVLYALLPILRNTYTGIRQVDPAVRGGGDRASGMTDGAAAAAGGAAARPARDPGRRAHRGGDLGRHRDHRRRDRRRRARHLRLPRARDRGHAPDPGRGGPRRAAGARGGRRCSARSRRRAGRRAPPSRLALGARAPRWRRLGLGVARGRREAVVVGSKNFTEQVVLGEILAALLEERGFAVDRRLNLGGTALCHEARARGPARRLRRIHGHGAHRRAEGARRLRSRRACSQTVRDGLRARSGLRRLRRSASTTRSRS